MTSHYPADLSSASDWLKQISLPARLIRSSDNITSECEISAIMPQTSFRRGTSGGVANSGGDSAYESGGDARRLA